MKTQGCYFPIVLLALTAVPAQADIYKCVDSDGNVTYSNVVMKNCKKLNLDSANTTVTSAPGPAGKSAQKTATPASFPKVDNQTQKARDTDRQRILESEQAAEQRNLEQAKKELAEQETLRAGDERNSPKGASRLQSFKDKIALHERNLEAIRKEIANLR